MLVFHDLSIQDALLSDIFKRETNNHITSIRTYISEYQDGQENYVDDNLMRALHTLHGSARMADAAAVASLSEALDRYFRTLHDKDLVVQEDSLSILSRSARIIDDAVKNDLDAEQVKNIVLPLMAEVAELHETVNVIVPDVVEPQETIETGFLSADEELVLESESGGDFKIEADDEELKSIFLDESKEIIKDLEKLTQR